VRYSIRTVGPIAPAALIPPVIELAEAKEHLRVDVDDDDALIDAFLAAAQDHVEQHTGQVLTPRVMEMALGGFPVTCTGRGTNDGIEIPRRPVTDVTAIAYTDSDGVDVSLDAADWRWSESEPSLLRPAFSTSWPSAYDERGSVRVQFEAGYEEGLAPASLVAAVKLMLGHLYANREGVNVGGAAAEMPLGVAQLCAPYRQVGL
jgi:uncharacterized phiE125 gp8 family phage protein